MFAGKTGLGDFKNSLGPDSELLSNRLARGPLAPFEGLRWALGIGAALNHLHANGGVHGGLAPELVLREPGGIRLLPRNPTRNEIHPYLSPEQLEGEEPDERSDVFSFGAIVYELVAGHPAFQDEGYGLGAAILHTEPPPAPWAGTVHRAMERVARDCMRKDPAQRRQRVQNAVAELKLVARSLPRVAEFKERIRAEMPVGLKGNTRTAAPQRARVAVVETAPEPKAVRRAETADRLQHTTRRRVPGSTKWWATGFGTLVLVAGGIWGGIALLSPRHEVPSLRLAATMPESATYAATPALSPDGKSLAFSAVGPGGVRLLWLRPFESGNSAPIPGTEQATAPFWSPDGTQIAFFAGQQLKSVRLGTGAIRVICPIEETGGGGSWRADGLILFAAGIAGPLSTVPASGGAPKTITALSPQNAERAHLWPQFLPDGQNYIVYVRTDNAATSGIYAGSLGHPALRRLMATEANARYVLDPAGSNGYLVFLKDRSLYAQACRPGGAPEGQPIELVRDVNGSPSLSLTPLSITNVGVLAYQSVKKPTRQLVWIDRSGKQLSASELPGDWGQVRITAKGDRAFTARRVPGDNRSELWSVDLEGRIKQITTSDKRDEMPIPSADGSGLVYSQVVPGDGRRNYDIVTKASLSAPSPVTLMSSPEIKYPTDWSRDGHWMLYTTVSKPTLDDIWVYSMKDRRASPLIQTVNSESSGVLSPDGKWLAYEYNETGERQVMIQRFNPGTAEPQQRWLITKDGSVPRWRSDGEEIFFLSADGALMAATTHLTGTTPLIGQPKRLFRTRPLPEHPCWYDAAPGGQRFLVNLPLEWSAAADIEILTNWTARLKR